MSRTWKFLPSVTTPNEKTVKDNPTLDSPAARTRLAIHRQATSFNVNGFEEPPFESTTLPNEKTVEDHVVNEEPPFEKMTLQKKHMRAYKNEDNSR